MGHTQRRAIRGARSSEVRPRAKAVPPAQVGYGEGASAPSLLGVLQGASGSFRLFRNRKEPHLERSPSISWSIILEALKLYHDRHPSWKEHP